LLFAVTTNPLLLIGIQLLDGISGSVLGVLTALIVADLTKGTGRFNLAQGFVGTLAGIGSAPHTLQPCRRNFWWRGWICQHCWGSTEHGLNRLAADAGNESVEKKRQRL
jgi:hypothetical protein